MQASMTTKLTNIWIFIFIFPFAEAMLKESAPQIVSNQFAGRSIRYGSLKVRTRKTAICARVTSASGQ